MVNAAFFRDVVGVGDDALCLTLASLSAPLLLAKGDYYLRTGDAQTHVAFLVHGCLRAFSTASDGTEVTDCLMTRPGIAVVPTPDLLGPSSENVEALTDCELAALKIEDVVALTQTNPEAASLQTRLLQEAWLAHHALESAIRSLGSRERYLWFLESYPGVIDTVPHRHIASFLGMTPVTLSRVRSALTDKTPPPGRF